MSEPFLGELRIVSFIFAPQGWALCNGQFLPINQNQALFSLLGTMYGGNGQTTFALPNMQGRVPMHVGGSHTQGEAAGQESHTVTQSEMPAHTHIVTATTATADTQNAAGNLWASGGQSIYSNTLNVVMAGQATNNAGGSQPHENRSPFLTLNFIICLIGIFPTRN
jgi:microcystin-dependent protein